MSYKVTNWSYLIPFLILCGVGGKKTTLYSGWRAGFYLIITNLNAMVIQKQFFLLHSSYMRAREQIYSTYFCTNYYLINAVVLVINTLTSFMILSSNVSFICDLWQQWVPVDGDELITQSQHVWMTVSYTDQVVTPL